MHSSIDQTRQERITAESEMGNYSYKTKSYARYDIRFCRINTRMTARRISTVNPTDNYVESCTGTKSSLPLMRHIPDSTDCLRNEGGKERERDREEERKGKGGGNAESAGG